MPAEQLPRPEQVLPAQKVQACRLHRWVVAGFGRPVQLSSVAGDPELSTQPTCLTCWPPPQAALQSPQAPMLQLWTSQAPRLQAMVRLAGLRVQLPPAGATQLAVRLDTPLSQWALHGVQEE